MLEQIIEYRFFLIAILVLLLVIIEVLSRKTKVEPIDMDKVLEQKDEKSKIEEVIEAMENNTSQRPRTTFEQEQEDNAIISYEELVKAVNEKKANSEFKTIPIQTSVKIDDEISEVLSELDQEEADLPEDDYVELEVEQIEEDNLMEEEQAEDIIKMDKPKFKNSEFISPVYGKDEVTSDDFLKELKDLRKNL